MGQGIGQLPPQAAAQLRSLFVLRDKGISKDGFRLNPAN